MIAEKHKNIFLKINLNDITLKIFSVNKNNWFLYMS